MLLVLIGARPDIEFLRGKDRWEKGREGGRKGGKEGERERVRGR